MVCYKYDAICAYFPRNKVRIPVAEDTKIEEYVRADGDGDIQLVLELWVHNVLVGPGGWSGWELIVGWCLRRKFYIERRTSPGPKRSLGTGRTDDGLSP